MRNTTQLLPYCLFILMPSMAHADFGIGTATPSNDLDVESDNATKTHVEINNTSTGDPGVNFQLNHVEKYTLGVDNSDDDKLKISTSTDFSVTPAAIAINSAQNIGINTDTPLSGLDVQSSMGLKVDTITTATTLNNDHNVLLCNNGPYTVTLPAASTNSGTVYYLKNIDPQGDNITIDGNASETIDGTTTYVLDTYQQAVRIISNGTSWYILDDITP